MSVHQQATTWLRTDTEFDNVSWKSMPQIRPLTIIVLYEGRSKSSRPDLVLFRIKLKYYFLLIVARLRTWHAQYDFWAKYYMHFSVWTQMGVENANTKLYTSFWRTSQTIPTWPSKNLFHNSLFQFKMKRASTTSLLSQNNKTCNGTNKLVKIVVSLQGITPFFPCQMQTTNDRWNAQNIYSAKVMSCSEPCYCKKQMIF